MKTLALILAASAASAALAEQQRPITVRGPHARYDPNEIVCRSEAEVGSRLRTHRICVTRAQWAEHVRQERQYVEKAQTNRTFCGGICTRRTGFGR